MTADTFLKNFGHLADAPNGIQKLRELILQLSVQGKLVPQDANDEPAQVLLDKIKPEKERLVKEGKFKSLDSTTTSRKQPVVFQIPDNWVWCKLNDIAAIARGGSPRPIKSYLTDEPDGLNWIKIGDSTRGAIYIDSTLEKIRPDGLKKTRMVYPGDLILSNSMSFGYPYIMNISGCIHDGWLVIRTPDDLVYKLYLYYLLASPHARKSFTVAAAGGVVQNLNADKVRILEVPLPPFEEQKRVVAKINELMALCDELEQRQQKQASVRSKLNKASLHSLTTATDDDAFQTAWARIRHNFDTLYTTPESIQDLRQSILQLAVQGKLVLQDPSDEPASILITSAREAITELADKRGYRKVKANDFQKLDPPEIQIPIGWELIRIGDIAMVRGGKRVPKGMSLSDNPTPHIYIQVTNMKNGTIVDEKIKYIDDEVYSVISKYIIEKSDIYITIAGTIGDVGIVPEKYHGMNLTENAARIIFRKLNKQFMVLCLQSSLIQNQFREKTNQLAQPKLALKRIASTWIPLPPLAEQHRIVAKVDNLMAICDQLESNLIKSQSQAEKLMAAIVHNLTNGSDSTPSESTKPSTSNSEQLALGV